MIATDTEQRVREAYWQITDGPKAEVPLGLIRKALRDVPATAVDAALRRMSNRPEVHLTGQRTLALDGPAWPVASLPSRSI